MKKRLVKSVGLAIQFAIFSHPNFAQQATGTVKGTVVDQNGAPIEQVSVSIAPLNRLNRTDSAGNFAFEQLPPDRYILTFSHLAYRELQRAVVLDKNTAVLTRQFILEPAVQNLRGVEVVGSRPFQTHTFMPAIQGVDIIGGKKNNVIELQHLDANLAENLPRQVFSKVPGAMVWEMDGTGNQVGIAVRGLIPHRSWELHVQQNGNTTNSDLFGYPESHYNPPMEAVGSIRLISGSGALQYGPQFGGLLDYEIKQPDTSRQIAGETRQSAGSNGLFGSFNALGGKLGKLTYYGYCDFRRSDGWRRNSDYHFDAWHLSLNYAIRPNMQLSAELSHMAYVNHFAAGLTDSLFEADARYSNRPRNYFNPTIYLPALHYTWQAAPHTRVSVKTSAILGERNSVQFIQLPTVDDTVNQATGQYNPRQVDRDYYHSYTAVARILHQYRLLKNESHFATGVKFGDSKTLRKQKGAGTGGSDFDLGLTAPYRIDLAFDTRNYALFAENLFQLTKNLSFTPGFRFEWIQTRMDGHISDLTNLQLPYRLNRRFPLFGAGLEYHIGAGVHAYANFTRNFRPVLHSDLIPPTDLDRIDPLLKDAKGNTSEFGIRGAWKDLLQFDLNYFRLQYDHRIGTLILSDDNGPYFYHTNIGDMVNQGSECYVEFHPLHLLASPPHGWDVALFSSTAYNSARYTRGSVTVAGENRDITGHAVENIPHWISRNGLSLRRRQVSATLQGSYVGANFSDALNTAYTPSGVNGIVPAYWLLDFSFTWHILEQYTIRCSVNNMADKRYFTRRATGYPGPGILPSDGRSVVVSVGATF